MQTIGWTYFILNQKTNMVKIGKSTDVGTRLISLQTASPDELCVILILPNIKDFSEKNLHHQFARYHVRGEWFHYDVEVKNFCEMWFKVLCAYTNSL
jgi:hypothetical protein